MKLAYIANINCPLIVLRCFQPASHLDRDCGGEGLWKQQVERGGRAGQRRRPTFNVRSWTGVRVGESRARGPLNLRKLCVLVCIRAVMHVLVMTPRRLVTAAAVARISRYIYHS